MYKLLIKPFLFRYQPEEAHHLTFRWISILFSIPGIKWFVSLLYKIDHPSLVRKVFGLEFPNPVGLAAGLDKDALLLNQWEALGFGFIEIGTLTPKAQPGNDKPRLFRLVNDEGIINRMGFNNRGVEDAVIRLKKKNTKILVGGNIGKNKVTPNEEAIRDYEIAFDVLFPYVDYFVVNVSSPNTPNLRALQDKEPLKALLDAVVLRNKKQPKPKPVLLKIAPDLTDGQLDDIVELVKECGIDGVIATNTTISRDGLKTSADEIASIGAGGLSGKPLRKRSTEVIAYLYKKSSGSFPIIGVGGIHTVEDALEKLNAGATLIQLYSGFIYEGPPLVKAINKALIKK